MTEAQPATEKLFFAEAESETCSETRDDAIGSYIDNLLRGDDTPNIGDIITIELATYRHMPLHKLVPSEKKLVEMLDDEAYNAGSVVNDDDWNIDMREGAMDALKEWADKYLTAKCPTLEFVSRSEVMVRITSDCGDWEEAE